MEKFCIRPIAIVFALLFSTLSRAQGSTEMADVMRSNGKIYVVVAVIAIIFVGIVIYLVSIDRKAARLEKEIKDLDLTK